MPFLSLGLCPEVTSSEQHHSASYPTYPDINIEKSPDFPILKIKEKVNFIFARKYLIFLVLQ